MGSGISPYPYPLIYPQDEHERLLIERLADLGVVVERETEVVSFEETADRVQVRIGKSDATIGWHSFRHSFGTLLKANGEDVKTVQELLRHANSRITLDVYTQAVNSHKRAAQSKVVKMMVPNLGETRGESHPRSA